jgi:hypothetical protein
MTRLTHNTMSLRAKRSNLLSRWDCFVATLLAMTLLISCAPVDLNAPIPTFDTGIDPNAWAQVPAGEFYFGQHEESK